MAFEVDDIAAGGAFFKPKEHADAVAILVEPKSFQTQVPSPYGPKDRVVADVTVFADQDALGNGVPTTVLQGARIDTSVDGALTRDIRDRLGKSLILKLDQVPSKTPGGHPAWVWRNTDGATKAAVVAYGEAREAAIQAAMADAPSFDD